MGINTDERYTNYYNSYDTTNEFSMYNNHVNITNDKFPNVVFERIAENVEATNDLLVENTASVAAANLRRKASYLNFEEMYNYANNHDHTLVENSIQLHDNVTRIKYGVDITFELTDKSLVTREIGSVSMGIDSLDQSGNPKAGFGVIAYDSKTNDQDPTKKELVAKNLLYVENDSTLNIKKLRLDGKIIYFDLIVKYLNNDDIILQNITDSYNVFTILKLLKKQDPAINLDYLKLQLNDEILDNTYQLVLYDITHENNILTLIDTTHNN